MELSRSTDNALRVLLHIERSGSQTEQELAQELSLSRGATSRVLATLRKRRFVIREINRKFALGPALMTLTTHTPNELGVAAQPHIDHLSSQLGETVIVATPSEYGSTIAAQSVGTRSFLQVEYQSGFRQPLTAGATSLAMAAFLPQHPAALALDEENPELLREVRSSGLARSTDSIRFGMSGLAAPLIAPNNRALGALGIIVPSERANRLEAYQQSLLSTATAIVASYTGMLAASRKLEAGFL